jgi:hypothetical protein
MLRLASKRTQRRSQTNTAPQSPLRSSQANTVPQSMLHSCLGAYTSLSTANTELQSMLHSCLYSHIQRTHSALQHISQPAQSSAAAGPHVSRCIYTFRHHNTSALLLHDVTVGILDALRHQPLRTLSLLFCRPSLRQPGCKECAQQHGWTGGRQTDRPSYKFTWGHTQEGRRMEKWTENQTDRQHGETCVGW